MGFAQTNVGLNMGLPGGSVEVHKFHTTEGFGLYDPSQVTCNPIDNNHTCIPQRDPWSDLSNAAHGHEYELDRYDSNGSTLLQKVTTTWAADCPAHGIDVTPPNPTYGNWNGNLVAELDHSNPVMVCEVHPTQVLHDTYDGTSGTPLRSVVTYTYDDLGRVASQTTQQGGTLAGDASGHGNLSIYGGGVTQQAAGLVRK